MDQVLLEEPDDQETFREMLETLVSTAYQNGVSVERDWPCRSDDDEFPNWAVDVVRLADGSDDS